MNTKQIRDSRFELLRIVAITFVFLHHSLMGLGFISYNEVPVEDSKKIIGIVLNSIFVIGVNLFFLISGYFGIRFKVSKLLYLLLLILGCCLFEFLFSGGIYRGKVLYSIIHLHTKNPFVPCYISLMLMSPLLNRGLSNLTYKELRIVVILFTIVSVFIGFILDYESISSVGYNLVNYIYIYILGYFLKVTPKIKTRFLITVYIVSFLSSISWAYFYKSGYSAFAYNNPFIILMSCSFFLLFSLIKINNRLINSLASGVFAMFLLESYVKKYFFGVTKELTGMLMIRNLLLDYIILFVFAFLITYIATKMMKIIRPKLDKVDNKFYIK